MFTGIIETTGKVTDISASGSNTTFWIESSISSGLKVDQSVSHSGVCLTVEKAINGRHRVTAIDETLQKTNLQAWKPGTLINLERCLSMNDRLDGHFVQGHVDTTGICSKRNDRGGSWVYEFDFPKKFAALIIEKGSIAVNGISLTAFDVKKKRFRVAIIPYTFDHTDLSMVNPGDAVNLEFDMTGKYINRYLQLKKSANK